MIAVKSWIYAPFCSENPDPRDVMVIDFANACGMWHGLTDDLTRPRIGAKMEQIAKVDPIGQAVGRAVGRQRGRRGEYWSRGSPSGSRARRARRRRMVLASPRGAGAGDAPAVPLLGMKFENVERERTLFGKAQRQRHPYGSGPYDSVRRA